MVTKSAEYLKGIFYMSSTLCVSVYILFCAVFQGQILLLDITYLVGRSIKSAAVSMNVMDLDVFCSD